MNADIVGDTFVGALAGQNRGTVSMSYATGKVDGRRFVGGLVGSNMGTDSEYPAVIEKSYSVVNVSGVASVGGLAGENSGLGGNATATESYAGGSTNGEEASGLVHVGAEPVTYSYWDINATGQNSSVGGTGLTTEQMTGETARGNMTGFDFESTWETVPEGYPRLSDALAPDAP